MKFIKGNIYKSKSHYGLIECIETSRYFLRGNIIDMGKYPKDIHYLGEEVRKRHTDAFILEQEMQDYEIF